MALLQSHPNDPGAAGGKYRTDFFTILSTSVPPGTSQDEVQQVLTAERARARELAGEGRLVRLWSLGESDGLRRTLAWWSADDADELTTTLYSLPLYPWMTVEVIR
ncbi:hypothetical protein BCA37_21085 [Mycobacterium sp. djl-10]|nr:hypothetical protein BCA37_21085 [Mycobacterium sp. djl-10]